MQSLRTLRLSIVSKRDRVLHKFSWSSTTTTTNANNSTLLFQNQRQPSQHTQFEDIISSYSTLSSENNSNSNNNNSNSKTNTTTPSPTSSSTTTPENNNNNHSGFKLFILNIYGHIRKFADELNQQVKHGVIAYYTNWKFYKDIIRPKQMMGTPLSRQEIISMNNFKKDSLYFVPLFVYLCVPFSTFGLPIYIKYLSAILPSTFSTREMIVKRYLNKLKKRTKHANSLYERLKSRDDILPNQKITLSNLNRGDLVLLYKKHYTMGERDYS
ncbi:hypothetical protein PPL_11199 [Heterostelium album PN500]|uniref:Letm1 RBD domain-containing protein n=1 Tax=Heterostelium pallidum (strain ATCC 26659 / Pp 5 / PN500) TaxID=670386 RepID=D3BTT9_HETP5|nr:hypothetical protein PPL_11199 [Heterostelium album PN500]EFA75125.1 hypothetical protein PPL_11199 [Heterostelium album PN500]|eukprot:XP_020427259.1 hypothetical protein PPL_11199 [Heterostelium album PN500]